MKSGPRTTQVIDFPQAQHLLYILTGIEPIKKTGKIDKFHDGEHLRFVFTGTKTGFDLVVSMLKLLDIQHCSELFKNVSPLETYITVSKGQFNKLHSYFAPGAFITLQNQGKQIDFFEQVSLQSAFINILFNPRFLDSIKTRNQGEYNLDGLMRHFGEMLISSAPCFAHLKERGVTTKLTVTLDAEEESSEETPAAITPLRNNKRTRVLPPDPHSANDDSTAKKCPALK